MGTIPTLDGIYSEIVATDRLDMHVLSCGPQDGTPVLFLHGNGTCSTFWEATMLDLPAGLSAYAPDLRGFGDTEPLPIDATLGLDDMVQDIVSLVDELDLERFHLVGHSLGGGVAMKVAIARPAALLSLVLVDTMSPYGYSGSKDADGTPCHEDGAPAGAASVNPEALQRLAAGDRSLVSLASPRSVLRQLYVKPPFVPKREEELVSAMLSISLGPDGYPGDFVPSLHWPGAAPGTRGLVNAVSRRYFDASALADIGPKPPILWVRGADDTIVSNMALTDIAALGSMGLVPGWPGPADSPPQPMIDQIQAVLNRYQAAGGRVQAEVIDDSGHCPPLEKPDQFNRLLHRFLAGA